MKPVVADVMAEKISAGGDDTLLHSFRAPRPSLMERKQAGKAIRREIPRAAHAELVLDGQRPDPVNVLEIQNRSRLKKLIPLRYARMLQSPFSFLRGAAAIMAADLATTRSTGIYVNACGDMHVANFGVFGSAERELLFAINDFDEVFPASWEWDVKRLAASATVAVHFMGGDKFQAFDAAAICMRAYRTWMARYAEMGALEVWYSSIDEAAILNAMTPKARRAARRTISKAKEKGHLRVLGRVTEIVDGEHQIIENPPLIMRETELYEGVPIDVALDSILQSYMDSLTFDRRRLLSRYRIADVARKVVGVGSVGTSCWVVLLKGAGHEDPLFLQVKEAKNSVLEPYSKYKLPFSNHGRRVVVGQRLVQGSPDIFLGWSSVGDKDFYIRQLADMKGSFEFDKDKPTQVERFLEYCALCGSALALAHAKSGDAAMISGYCGGSEALDEAIAKFAASYFKQTLRDYEALEAARLSGRIAVDGG